MKRWLSVLLVLCMVVTLLPLGALAAEDETGEIATVETVEETTEETTEDTPAEPTSETTEEVSDETDEESSEETTETTEESSEETTEETTEESTEETTEETTSEETTEETTEETALDGAATYYELYIYAGDYGTVEVDGFPVTDEEDGNLFSYTAGQTVTITATPDSGFMVSSVSCSSWGEAIDFTTSGNTYTFTMPARVASFSVSFAPSDSYRVTWHENGIETTEYCARNEYVYIHSSWESPGGKIFSAWAVNNDNTKLLRAGDLYKFTANTDLYAIYVPAVTLTFHYPTENRTEAVPKGEEYEVFGYGGEDGQVITGWYTADGETIPNGSYYVFHENTDLYPIYEDAYSVTLHYASGYTDTQLIEKGGTIALDLYAEDGSVVKYWAVGSQNGEVVALPGDFMTAVEVTGNMHLYQVTTTDTVTITYNSNDSRNKSGQTSMPRNSDVGLLSSTVIFPLNFGAPYGKELLGWSKTPNGEPLTTPCQFSSDTTLYAVWGDQVLVTYDANGGLGGLQMTAALGGCAEEYNGVVNRSGYILTGWATDKAGKQLYDFSKPLTGDLTLYAVWGKAINVEYVFWVDDNLYGWIDGDPVAKNDSGVYKIPMDHEVMNFVPNGEYPPEGYEFYTWYYSVDTEGDYYVTTSTVREDGTEVVTVDFEAGWRPTSSVMTVESDGYVKSAKVGTRILADGEKYITDVGDTVKLTVVPKSGYVVESVYGGYYDYDARRYKEVTFTEASGGYTFTAPKGEVEIRVLCRPSNSFAVTYHWGGDNEPDPVYVTADDYLLLYRDTYFSEDSQVLRGWAVGSADSKTILLPGSSQKFTKATDLYAVYETGVALRYHWSAEEVDTNYVISGQPSYVMVPGAVTEDGKYAYAWSDRQNSAGTGDPAGTLYYGGYNVFYQATDLYPVYTDAAKVTLHYSSGRTDTWYMMADETRMLPDAVRDDPIKHWAVGSASGTQKYAPGEEVSFDKDTELYAVMATDVITLTLHSNDIRDAELTLKVAKNSPVYLFENIDYTFMPPAGKELVGWSETKNGALISGEQTFAADTDLYAIWGKQVLVTYDPNGGVAHWGDTSVVAAGACAEEYTQADRAVTRAGYSLLGWSVNKSGTPLYDFSQPVEDDLTLYAVWGIAVTYVFMNESTEVARVQGAPVAENTSGEYWVDPLPASKLPANPTKPGAVFRNWQYYGMEDHTTGKYQVTMSPGDKGLTVYLHASWKDIKVEVNSNGFGTVKVNGTAVEASMDRPNSVAVSPGSTVTVEMVPLEGYEKIDVSWDCYDSDTREDIALEVTKNGNTYTFTMPEESVSVRVNFYASDSIKLTTHYPNNTTATEYLRPGEPYYLMPVFGEMFGYPEGTCTYYALGSKNGSLLASDTYHTFDKDSDLYIVPAPAKSVVQVTVHGAFMGEDEVYSVVKGNCLLVDGVYAEGKTCVGFSTKPDGKGDIYGRNAKIGPFDKDTDLYPIWEEEPARITVTYQGDSRPNTVEKGKEYTVRDWFSGSGTLLYWAVGSAEGTTHYLPGETVTLNSDITLYPVTAAADAETVTITYHSNDARNLTETRTAVKGAEMLLSDYKTDRSYRGKLTYRDDGMLLLGWSKTPNGALLSDKQKFDSNTNLYAVWGKTILVTYDPNGGVGGSCTYAAAGEKLTNYTADSYIVSREGYRLMGWATDTEGKNRYDFSKAPTESITLYAIWLDKDSVQPGDIDGNGDVDIMDVLALLKFVANITTSTVGNGDVNGNGKVDIMDVLHLLKFVAGIISADKLC